MRVFSLLLMIVIAVHAGIVIYTQSCLRSVDDLKVFQRSAFMRGPASPVGYSEALRMHGFVLVLGLRSGNPADMASRDLRHPRDIP